MSDKIPEDLRDFHASLLCGFAATPREVVPLIERIARLEAENERLSAPVSDGKYFILTKAHEAIWPRGVILFWGPNSNGYSTTLELAGRYTKDEAESICKLRPQSGNPLDFMVPCETVEAQSRRIVDIDQFNALLAARKEGSRT